MKMILVTGAPATGKTLFAPRIAEALKYPLIQRDGMKEVLYDSLGYLDREWSQKLGGAAWELLWHVMEMQMRAGVSFVVDAHFEAKRHTERFQAWQKRFQVITIQVHLSAEHDVRYKRSLQRATSGERHPGHVDNLTTYRHSLNAERERDYSPMALGGTIIEVNTTDFSTVDYNGVIEQLAQLVDTSENVRT